MRGAARERQHYCDGSPAYAPLQSRILPASPATGQLVLQVSYSDKHDPWSVLRVNELFAKKILAKVLDKLNDRQQFSTGYTVPLLLSDK